MAGKKAVSLAGLFAAAAIVLALFSVGTLFAEWHRTIELFSHFRLQYLGSSLLLLLVFAVLRRRNFSLLLVALVLLNACFVLPWYMSNDRPETGGKPIKILQANVLRKNPETAALLAQISAENPDLVILQEMTPPWLQAMQSLSAKYPYSIAEAQEGAFGIMIDEQRISLVSAHSMPPIGRASIETRNAQLAVLGEELGKSTRPTIFVGDLNISMWAPTYLAFEKASGLRNGRKGFGLVPTFPVFFPLAAVPIDHCLVSAEIDVLEFRTGTRIGSDHWPVIVTLALAD
jgi:endonuclease/exonuclease/phosphatase (EEP) superfamily protein YafD